MGDATLEQLQDRLLTTIRVENQAAAIRAETLAEMTRREGVHPIDNYLREIGLRSRHRARSEVEIALLLEGSPLTFKGLRDGEIPYENAEILARACQRGR